MQDGAMNPCPPKRMKREGSITSVSACAADQENQPVQFIEFISIKVILLVIFFTLKDRGGAVGSKSPTPFSFSSVNFFVGKLESLLYDFLN